MARFLILLLPQRPLLLRTSPEPGAEAHSHGRHVGPALLVLKQEGNAVTGTAGPDANQGHPISNGKVETNVAFEVDTPDGVMKFASSRKATKSPARSPAARGPAADSEAGGKAHA